MNFRLVKFYFRILNSENYKQLLEGINSYQLLGVTPFSSKDEIDIAYKTLMEKIHPEAISDNSVYKERAMYLNERFTIAYNSIITRSHNNNCREFKKEENGNISFISEMKPTSYEEIIITAEPFVDKVLGNIKNMNLEYRVFTDIDDNNSKKK